MTLSKLDCYIHTAARAEEERAGDDGFSYQVLNPDGKPGSFFVACAFAAREAIGSQVAFKLTLEHLTNSVIDSFEGLAEESERSKPGGDWTVEVLERGLSHANKAVFNFGSKLGGGGRTSAALVTALIARGAVAVARAGMGSAFLLRNGEAFPFFEPGDSRSTKDPTHGLLVGVQPSLAIEVASVPLQGGDQLFCFSRTLSTSELEELIDHAEGIRRGRKAQLVRFCSALEYDPVFAVGVDIGPDTIYLSNAVSNSSKALGELAPGQSSAIAL